MTNSSIWLSLLRSVVVALCGMLVAKGVITAADAPAVQTALETLLPALVAAGMGWWEAHTHTDASKIVATAAIPEVSKVEIKQYATGSAAAVAADPDQPKVKQQGTTS